MNTHNYFSKLPPIKTPDNLKSNIHDKVLSIERRANILRFVSFAAFTCASVSAFVASCVYAWNGLLASGFGQFASLVFSDTGAALSYSRELGLSLIESLPAFGIALTLASFVACLWSLPKLINFVKQYRNFSVGAIIV